MLTPEQKDIFDRFLLYRRCLNTDDFIFVKDLLWAESPEDLLEVTATLREAREQMLSDMEALDEEIEQLEQRTGESATQE